MSECFETIDFHSHILPSIDHGCKSIDECKNQLALMKQNGTALAVATPHFYPHEHKVSDFLANVSEAVLQMRSADIGSAPHIAIGAEVLLCRNLHKMEGFRELCIRGTDTLLLELPMRPLTHAHFDTVEAMIDNGITVVLAHIDRYLKEYAEAIDTLLSIGAYAQCNANSLIFGKAKRKIFSELEHGDKICAIGSDLHGVDTSAYKKFTKAKKVLGEYEPIIMQRSKNLLRDAEIITF